MKKLFLLFLAYFAITFTSVGQGRYIDDSYLLRDYEVEQINESQSIPDNIDGSPYLTDAFKRRDIFFDDKKDKLRALLRYNAYSGEFEFSVEGKSYVIGNKEQIDSIHYSDQDFVYISYRGGDGEKKQGYAASLVQGDCNLYKIYRVRFHEEEPPRPGHVDYKPARFEMERPLYLIQFDDQLPHVIESFRRRKFVDHFNGNKKDHMNFIREHRLRLYKEEDLLNFIDYYNGQR